MRIFWSSNAPWSNSGYGQQTRTFCHRLADLGNPFLPMKLNSDLMHREMVRLMDQLPLHVRHRIYDWFLL